MRRWVIVGIGLLAVLPAETGRALAQAPTIDTGTPSGPGANASSLGSSPGANDSMFGSAPGAGGGAQGGDQGGSLGGRPGPSFTRAPASVTMPSGGLFNIPEQRGIAAPAPLPVAEMPIYGTLEEPDRPTDEGPPNGLTLDQAIELLLRNNLDLRAQYFEITMAESDVLTASLRANPVFYADSQLVPYGQYTIARPGGQTQYDVNVSYPLDVSLKRRARVRSAVRAKRVIEAQYQDAVRLQIDNLYTAYVDVLAARETVRYAAKSVSGLQALVAKLQARLEAGEDITVQVSRARSQLRAAQIGLADARAAQAKANQQLGTLLFLRPEVAAKLKLRGTIQDRAPPPPAVEELIQIALESRPDLIAFQLGLQRAEADVLLQKANRYQDWYLLYQPYTLQNNAPFGLKSPTSWALGITVPLPLYNRNQGLIQRARENVSQTRVQLEALERKVINDVIQAHQEYTISRQAVRSIEEPGGVLPNAREVRNTILKRVPGEESYIALLEALREYNDVVKQYRDTVVRHRRSMLDLNTAVGQRILP
jgi:cobalt-zinc-cadmium efflux system outer membrane protein